MAKSKNWKDLRAVVWAGGKDNPDVGDIPGLVTQESRNEIREQYQQLGFVNVWNTDKIDAEIMNENLSRLKELEAKYGAIKASENPVLNGVQTNAFAYVASIPSNRKSQSLNFSLGEGHTSANELAGRVIVASKIGNFMPFGKSRKEAVAYTVTHEYGHMVQNIMYSNYKGNRSFNSYSNNVAMGIIATARRKYGMSNIEHISRYGLRSPQEFFAEAFANAHSSTPNAVGLAMQDFLRKQGY